MQADGGTAARGGSRIEDGGLMGADGKAHSAKRMAQRAGVERQQVVGRRQKAANRGPLTTGLKKDSRQ